MVNQSWRQLLIVAIALILYGCPGGDYEIQLPHGYFIARVQPGHFVLVAPDRHTIVLPAVRAYFVQNGIVVGEVAEHGASSAFFILDTRDGTLNANLRLEQWERRVRTLGITAKSLHQPKPLDSILANYR